MSEINRTGVKTVAAFSLCTTAISKSAITIQLHYYIYWIIKDCFFSFSKLIIFLISFFFLRGMVIESTWKMQIHSSTRVNIKHQLKQQQQQWNERKIELAISFFFFFALFSHLKDLSLLILFNTCALRRHYFALVCIRILCKQNKTHTHKKIRYYLGWTKVQKRMNMKHTHTHTAATTTTTITKKIYIKKQNSFTE